MPLFLLALAATATIAGAAEPTPQGRGYREPSEAVTRLLSATRPPEPLVHARSGQVALLYRKPLVPLARLVSPKLGLAGYRFDVATRTSTTRPWVESVEVVRVGADPAIPAIRWEPLSGPSLDHVAFSPDGRFLSAVAVTDMGTRLVFFEIAKRRELVLPTAVNAAFGDPCSWLDAEHLLCRVVPEDPGDPPIPGSAPIVVEHGGGPAPMRTYQNLLEDDHSEALFDYYFRSELAVVGFDGKVRRLPVRSGSLRTCSSHRTASTHWSRGWSARTRECFPRAAFRAVWRSGTSRKAASSRRPHCLSSAGARQRKQRSGPEPSCGDRIPRQHWDGSTRRRERADSLR